MGMTWEIVGTVKDSDFIVWCYVVTNKIDEWVSKLQIQSAEKLISPQSLIFGNIRIMTTHGRKVPVSPVPGW